MSLPEPIRSKIEEIVRSTDVVLFMKGGRRFPQCGFSSQVVQILDGLGVPYRDVNILTDPGLRDGIKVYSQWPTIPQLYVKGEFVGGCDIVKEMHANGELAALVAGAAPPKAAAPTPAAAAGATAPPTLRLSDEAAAAIRDATEPGSGDVLRFEIAPGFRYDLSFAPRQPGDVEVVVSGVTIAMDAATAAVADGTAIAFVDGDGGGFKITNPREPVRVKQLSPADLKAKLDAKESFTLLDVRTDGERAIAVIPGAKPYTEASLEGLDKAAPVVFHCHHGGRSQAAAEHAVTLGFKDVANLRGGIDAWSMTVDPAVKRY